MAVIDDAARRHEDVFSSLGFHRWLSGRVRAQARTL